MSVTLSINDLNEWNENKNKMSSIYVKWVPNELTEDIAKDYFTKCLGIVSRLEFAKHKSGKGRILFVHFSSWSDSEGSINIRNSIINSHGSILEIKFETKDPNKLKSYDLKCYVNTRPIQIVEYNNYQLYDMIQTLNKEISNLKFEISNLNCEIDNLNGKIDDIKN